MLNTFEQDLIDILRDKFGDNTFKFSEAEDAIKDRLNDDMYTDDEVQELIDAMVLSVVTEPVLRINNVN